MAAQLDRACCGRLHLTFGGSWLPGGRWAGPKQGPGDDPKVPDSLGVIGGGLQGSDQSPTAAQLGRDRCGRLQLTRGIALKSIFV